MSKNVKDSSYSHTTRPAPKNVRGVMISAIPPAQQPERPKQEPAKEHPQKDPEYTGEGDGLLPKEARGAGVISLKSYRHFGRT